MEISEGKIGLAAGIAVVVILLAMGGVVLLYESTLVAPYAAQRARKVTAEKTTAAAAARAPREQVLVIAALYRQRSRHMLASNSENAELSSTMRGAGKQLADLASSMEMIAEI